LKTAEIKPGRFTLPEYTFNYRGKCIERGSFQLRVYIYFHMIGATFNIGKKRKFDFFTAIQGNRKDKRSMFFKRFDQLYFIRPVFLKIVYSLPSEIK